MADQRNDPITNVAIVGDTVKFRADGTDYLYIPSGGRIYVGAAGTVIHQARDGSFDFGGATGGQVAMHAKLFGATISVAR